MTTTTKHIAIDPAGFTHKRSSKSRGYSHTVVATPSYRHALAWASKISKQDIDNFAYHWDLATTGQRDLGRGLVTRLDSFGRDAETERAKHYAELGGTTNAEAYATMLRDRRVAQVNADKLAGGYDKWRNLGWCSRSDLAQSLARREAGKAYWDDVRILEAEVVA